MDPRLSAHLELSRRSPRELHFESSSRCNGACITCPREGMQRSGEMSREIFVKGVDEAAAAGWRLDYFHYHLNGEPLFLDIDELVWRIDYSRDKLPGKPVLCFFTNASLLTSDKSLKILNSKLDKIVFSIDGGTKEAFERCRPGLKWETVVGNVRNFMALKRELGSTIATQTAFVPSIYNQESLKHYYPLFKSMGIDDVGGSGVNNIGGLIDSKAMRLPAQYTGGNVKAACWRVFIDLSICSDGKAVVCCQDVGAREVIGDLNKESIVDIWQKGMRRIQDLHLELRQGEIPFCKNCDYMNSFCFKEEDKEWWPTPTNK